MPDMALPTGEIEASDINALARLAPRNAIISRKQHLCAVANAPFTAVPVMSRDHRAAWVRLPNEVARDKRLSDAGLVRLAYRATFVGTFALNATALLRRPIVRGAGFGRDVIERATAEGVACGYLERWQPRRAAGKTFASAVEKLTLPPCGASGNAGRMVYRKWFDATLSVQEMAAYLYLRAGTGNGPGMYAKELAARFGWSRPTAAKVI